jgi:hypothetical protein
MATFCYRALHPESAFKMAVLFIIFLLYGCTNPSDTHQSFSPTSAPSNDAPPACIDVYGKVFGDIVPFSTVSLYQTMSVDYATVMTVVRTEKLISQTLVNETNGFSFKCLSTGKYIAVTPATLFINQSVGSPLPYEFDCRNFSLSIAFHGGDSEFLVGVFSILNVSTQKKIECGLDLLLCNKKKGRLYRRCHQNLS